jgi:hypothetical protein
VVGNESARADALVFFEIDGYRRCGKIRGIIDRNSSDQKIVFGDEFGGSIFRSTGEKANQSSRKANETQEEIQDEIQDEIKTWTRIFGDLHALTSPKREGFVL